MQDGEGHRTMELMLRSDNDGIEEAPVGSIIQCISQRNGRAEVYGVHHQPKGFHTSGDLVSIVPAWGECN